MTATPSPAASLVRAELARAAAGVLAGPWHLGRYLLQKSALQAEFAADLAAPAPPAPLPEPRPLPDRPLRVFLSCAEPSGELHALELLPALTRHLAQRGAPAPEVFGLGGARSAAAGVEIVGDPVQRAAMGFGVVFALGFYLRLLRGAVEAIETRRPDVLIAVDSPALHVPLGRMARRLGVPVVHFATPQYWGWAPWRVRGYGAAVDRALTILPFEPAWFARRGVPAVHVGHPLLDRLETVPRRDPAQAGRRLVVLAGSRSGVVGRNLPWMIDLLQAWRREHPEAELVIAQDRTELVPNMRAMLREAGAEDWLSVSDQPLHEVLRGAHAVLSVSGTVLLDVLHHRLPVVVIYRVGSRHEAFGARHLLTVPYFASINLLAGEEVAREFCFHGNGPREAVLAALDGAWREGPERERMLAGLERAAESLGPPGACDRAAAWAIDLAAARHFDPK